MNSILLLLIIMTSMLIAGSSNMIYSRVTALDTYFTEARVGEYLDVAYDNEENNRKIEEWKTGQKGLRGTAVLKNSISIRSKPAIPLAMHQQIGVSIGDQLEIHVGSIKREFTIAAYSRDAIFGSAMMGLKRIAVKRGRLPYLW